MNRRLRTYYYGVLGGIGGLIGWQISNLIGLSFTKSIYLNDLILGALIGLSVGLLIGIAEGLFTLNWARMLRAGFIGGVLGLIAGAIGLPFGEMLFQLVGAGFIGRALGWGFFGLMIGLAEGLTGGSQMWKGALGGALGGLVGAILLEAARSALGNPVFGKALGLILLGASVGALIALIIVLLSRAWLEVASGKLRGTEFILDKFMKKSGPSAEGGYRLPRSRHRSAARHAHRNRLAFPDQGHEQRRNLPQQPEGGDDGTRGPPDAAPGQYGNDLPRKEVTHGRTAQEITHAAPFRAARGAVRADPPGPGAGYRAARGDHHPGRHVGLPDGEGVPLGDRQRGRTRPGRPRPYPAL
jgi:hypothetical protein